MRVTSENVGAILVLVVVAFVVGCIGLWLGWNHVGHLSDSKHSG